MNAVRPGLALDTMLARVAIAARAPLPERPLAVADAIAPFLGDPTLLEGRACPCCADHHARHLLGEGEGWAAVAIVWRPGQMSPVHAHRTWCALGVHRGTLTEHFFEPGDPPRPAAALLRRPGETSQGGADPRLIHRLGNCAAEDATSLHVYGAAYERFGDAVNLVLG